ncbi:bifunctional tryptophan synthase trp1 [Tulasnella sp. UAMH 9824]|nr:bifunctional tryptophan synthase trp1 [Tulasnella sp. UAMH 9824]
MPVTIPQDGRPQTLLIDNFDSFTWNLYQYLCILGASVTVIRNDEITPEDFPSLPIANLIISPGPGHPQTDSGISRDAIRYFAGKIPVLGVCMGLECLVDAYGGTIAYAGEIMHGKTSKVRHDSKGIFIDIPQGIPSTRYHSLSASATTLPPNLAITATTEESGVIMAVRHRHYTVEAVQYHPESIMSDKGSAILKNFLDLKGGTWEENPQSRVLDPQIPPFEIKSTTPATAKKGVPSILEKIHAQRLKDVQAAKETPGTTPSDFATLLSLHLAPPQIPLVPRIRDRKPALMAEIKRASPSKGPIAMNTNAAEQALTYALGGASVISVLTEPTWFKGSLLDMRMVRQAIDSLPNRPAVLRKDFIIDEYQISEARLHGADTILLIVAILPKLRLKQLYTYAVGMGMEPLVEVNNAAEMELALEVGAKVIGVNNRNLHDFEVDMGTTTRLAEMCKERDVILCALSGISGPEDVRKYVEQGVGAILVGESLMRAGDPKAFIAKLLDMPPPEEDPAYRGPLVKICGVRNKDTALVAAEAGADMIGMIFAQGSKRKVELDAAREVSLAVRAARQGAKPDSTATTSPSNSTSKTWFASAASSFPAARPLVVGVFQDQPLEEVVRTVEYAQLDLVQLHGNEPIHWSQHIPVPVVKVFHLPPKSDTTAPIEPRLSLELSELGRPGYHKYILLDSMRPGSKLSGGSGVAADWELAKSLIDAGEAAGAISSSKRTGNASAVASAVEAVAHTGSAKPEIEALKDPLAPLKGEGKEQSELSPSVSGVPESLPGPKITKVSESGRLPVILAGGLTVDNVKEAVGSVRPWAVDVSGGVEAEGSVEKDEGKLKAFILAAKSGW